MIKFTLRVFGGAPVSDKTIHGLTQMGMSQAMQDPAVALTSVRCCLIAISKSTKQAVFTWIKFRQI